MQLQGEVERLSLVLLYLKNLGNCLPVWLGIEETCYTAVVVEAYRKASANLRADVARESSAPVDPKNLFQSTAFLSDVFSS